MFRLPCRRPDYRDYLRRLAVAFAGLGTVVAIPPALAAQVAVGQATDGAAAGEPKPTPTLKPADADGDGKITRAEWTRFAQSFRRFDANKDNSVDLAELSADEAASNERSGESIVLVPVDTNGDGKLSRAEWTALAASFKRIDADGNGALDLAEFQTLVDAKNAASKPGDVAALRAGLWRGAIVEKRGENPNSGTPIELLIAGNRIAGRDLSKSKKGDEPNLGVGTFVASGKADIGYLDAQYLDGTDRICLGIFRMQGDTLYWCVSNRTGQRPEDFVTANGFWLMILKRVPDEKSSE
ncbi:MAG: EF-hand domain-containing protein [Planctomycetia bacterium]|nr:EF-hand domain-containing protein [Planctomycetia bacterium]